MHYLFPIVALCYTSSHGMGKERGSKASVIKAEAAGMRAAVAPDRAEDLSRYRGNPVLYARERLGLRLWSRVEEILMALERPPYRTLVKSGHKVGKTHA